MSGLFTTYYEGMDPVVLGRFSQDRITRNTTPLPLDLQSENKPALIAQISADQQNRFTEDNKDDLLARLAEDLKIQETSKMLSVHGDGDCCLLAITVSLFVEGILNGKQELVADLMQEIVDKHYKEVMDYEVGGEYIYPLVGDDNQPVERDLYKVLLDSVIDRYRKLTSAEDCVEFCLSFLDKNMADINMTKMEFVSFFATCLRFEVREAVTHWEDYPDLIETILDQNMFVPKSYDDPQYYIRYLYERSIQLLMYRKNVEAREPRFFQMEEGFQGNTLLALHILLFQGEDRMQEGANHYYVMVMQDLVEAFENRIAESAPGFRPVTPPRPPLAPAAAKPAARPATSAAKPAEQEPSLSKKLFPHLKTTPKTSTAAVMPPPPVAPMLPSKPAANPNLKAAAQAIFGGASGKVTPKIPQRPAKPSVQANPPAPVGYLSDEENEDQRTEFQKARDRILNNKGPSDKKPT